ncbi:MAG: ATP-grasp domain-containing protein [Cognaticolwellia sp.]
MRKCAILSMDSVVDFEVYDYLLDEPMLALGWQTEVVSWRSNKVDWSDYEVVIIRSPWDYQDDMASFLQVLSTIEQSNACLENSLAVVKWNINKGYLKSLAAEGVTIVPTLWPDMFNAQQLTEYFAHFSTEQMVLKPRVSANADNTFWLTQDNYQDKIAELTAAFASRELMVQPFIANICSEGEFSLFYFNGEFSHAILKTPAQGDFRVQEEHGGALLSITPEPALVAVAEQTMQAITNLHGALLYVRIDFVRYNNSFALMEAELIEPSLYFNMDANSPQRFANAFVARISSNETSA